MLFRGGYRYPSGFILLLLTGAAITVTLVTVRFAGVEPGSGLVLFLQLEGAALGASALTPVGLSPPPKGVIQFLRWFTPDSLGAPMAYNQLLLYGGLLVLGIASGIAAAVDWHLRDNGHAAS